MSDNDDFAGLRLAAERAARQPEFSAIEARARTGRRASARNRVVLSGAAAFLAVLGVTGIAVSALPHDEPSSVASAPGRPVPASPAPPVTAVDSIGWAGAGDAQHLYAVSDPGPLDDSGRESACAKSPTECVGLYGSDDGGATWQPRTLPGKEWSRWSISTRVLGPRVLAGLPTGKGEPTYLSTDGGRTWRADARSSKPIAAVSEDGLLACSGTRDAKGRSCRVYGYGDGRLAPLAVQPPIDVVDVVQVPAAAGLWVYGYDSRTQRPALAVSRDGGETWQSHVFSAEPPPPTSPLDEGLVPTGWAPTVVTVDGRTVHAVLQSLKTVDGEERDAFTVYTSTDGGTTWIKRPNADGMAAPFAFATNDGELVTMTTTSNLAGIVPLRSRNGGPFREVPLSGVDVLAAPPTPIGSGRFLAFTDEAVLTSPDGFAWQRSLP